MIPRMTLTTAIPNWNANGVLPPIAPGVAGNSPNRSPYLVGLPEFVDRFSYSKERIALLDDFFVFEENYINRGCALVFSG